MAKKQPIVTGYYRVGSKEQLGKKLGEVRTDIILEEENMKRLAQEFLESSEKYNKLRNTQRSLMSQMFIAGGE